MHIGIFLISIYILNSTLKLVNRTKIEEKINLLATTKVAVQLSIMYSEKNIN